MYRSGNLYRLANKMCELNKASLQHNFEVKMAAIGDSPKHNEKTQSPPKSPTSQTSEYYYIHSGSLYSPNAKVKRSEIESPQSPSTQDDSFDNSNNEIDNHDLHDNDSHSTIDSLLESSSEGNHQHSENNNESNEKEEINKKSLQKQEEEEINEDINLDDLKLEAEEENDEIENINFDDMNLEKEQLLEDKPIVEDPKQKYIIEEHCFSSNEEISLPDV